jgi:hypothetical protein
MTGKCLKLTKSILAIDEINGNRDLVTVPADSTITIEAEHISDGRLVDVRWNGRIVAMFAIDVEARGYEVRA